MPAVGLVLFFFLVNVLGQFGLAVLVNRTIDDYFGDPITGTFPTYSPAGLWQQGNGCSGCTVRPNSSLAFDGTWHDTTYYIGNGTRSVSVNFTGSAVYAFFITAPIIPGSLSSNHETHLNITLDGILSGSYDSIPSGSNYGYNQLVYGNASLNYGNHTLVIWSGGPKRSVLEFDYVMYTTDDGTTASSTGSTSATSATAVTNSSSTVTPGAIAGGVVGGIVMIAIIMLLICSYYNRDRRRTTAIANEAKNQEAAAGPQTLRAFMPTTSEINPFVVPSNPTFFHGSSKEKQPLRNPNTAPTTEAELTRRIQELQQEMNVLQPRDSLSLQRPSSSREGADDWRSNLEVLCAEVRRLRLLMLLQPPPEQPPEYVHSVSDEVTSLGGPA